MSKTRRNVTKGWKKEQPSYHQRTLMLKRCGKKCFLGSKKKYPICIKNTCKISTKGVYSAYIRARQYHKKNISSKAKKLLIKMGAKR
jgi:hypothetical protein